MASALTTSAPSRSATASASSVLPAAVGPTRARPGPGRGAGTAGGGVGPVTARSEGLPGAGGRRSWRGQEGDQVADAVGRVVVEDLAAHGRAAAAGAGGARERDPAGDQQFAGLGRVEVEQPFRLPAPERLG